MRVWPGLLVLGAVPLWPQTAAAPRFDAAVVKPAAPEEAASGNSGMASRHGRLTAYNVTLKRCIIGAYHVGPGQIVGGPGWMDSDRFHIEAEAAEPTNDLAVLDAMTRALLEDRFQLKVHRETKDMQALVLEVAKGGPRLQQAAGGDAVTDAGQGSLRLKNTKMAGLAERLSRVTGLPVVNQTGIDGIFDMTLTWTPTGETPAGGGAPPDLPTAIREQLGLRLQSRKAPVEVLVVDRAERPTAN